MAPVHVLKVVKRVIALLFVGSLVVFFYRLFGAGSIFRSTVQCMLPQFPSTVPITKELFNQSYDRERLCLSQTFSYQYPMQWSGFDDPVIVWEWNYSVNANDISPDYSIIINAFDSLNNGVLQRVIESALIATRGKWELIVVFDAVDDICVDTILNLLRNKLIQSTNNCSIDTFRDEHSIVYINNSRSDYLTQDSLVYEYCTSYNNDTISSWLSECGQLQRIVLVRAEGIWETSANNLGMCLSAENTKFHIHVQDDMQMTQIGWNIEIVLPLILFERDIFSVSARCATNLQNLFRGLFAATANEWSFMNDSIARQSGQIASRSASLRSIGRCGADINKPLKRSQRGFVYERNSNNRGPLAFNASEIKRLGYFNERSFKLLFDIGELSLRAMTFIHKHSAYMPLQFRADLDWGGTRRKRRQKTEFEEEQRRAYEKFRNDRRDESNAFVAAGKDRYIANYDGKREITMAMIHSANDKFHFCE